MKKIISIILSLSILLFCMVALSSCKKIDTEISNYELKRQEIGNAAEMMPSLSDLGNYSGINYSHQVREDFIFVSDAFSLFVKYSPSEYESKKQEILSSHTFLTSEITDDDGYYLIPVAKFDYMDYHFQIVKDEYGDYEVIAGKYDESLRKRKQKI